MTTLIKDLIDIPERVQKGDYVLKLVEDIKRPEVVLDNYVVTPERCGGDETECGTDAAVD